MIIISWDVGIIHLAYCVLEYIHDGKKDESPVRIIDWDEINLIEDERVKLSCCGQMKTKKGETAKICGKNATYFLQVAGMDKSVGFCKTHLSQHTTYWSNEKTKALFKQISPEGSCSYVKTDGSECGKTCKFVYTHNNKKLYYCTTHYKSELNKRIKEFSPQPIKNLIVRKYPTDKLQFNLVKKLDELSEHFAKLKIEEVVIENQPSQKNPKMKSIANTLFDYFLIRGYVDKIHHMDIKLVRFMCPSNKLKVNNDNTIEVFKANKDNKKKYKLTKALGIQYTRQLLNDDEKQLEYLELYKKKDDICDAYLQGRYYLEFIRNKNNNTKNNTKNTTKNIGGSKTTKKSKEIERNKEGNKTRKRKLLKTVKNKNSIKNNSKKQIKILSL
ncbi:holliday junction resolvase [Tupanvirus soda lake]|uniref:Holliday junction resolvase n=2 Tax=Tupanvirus TaxID=2094720 RepID=A0A6N1NV98_9VIRU|nr:holliday junction resolvase [Tupanvirus soda lake]QKU35396.1 holliday junction resolvase [Tupanvirus soda lake]